MPNNTRRQVLASAGVLLSVGVVTGDTTSQGHPKSTSRTSLSNKGDSQFAQQTSAVEAVATDLEVPWGTDFAPDGTFYFTERTGRVNRLSSDGVEILAEIDDTNVVGEGGCSDSRSIRSSRPRRPCISSKRTKTVVFHSVYCATVSLTANSNAKP
ncbi:hypothetical protein ACFFQF_26140 [Haladaptatus pallidirubidus]|uniref:hypothetical protein n=1 Tax=Haladaptatus pallidirubidus TaxID=1008152 RepID=UPI0035E591FF